MELLPLAWGKMPLYPAAGLLDTFAAARDQNVSTAKEVNEPQRWNFVTARVLIISRLFALGHTRMFCAGDRSGLSPLLFACSIKKIGKGNDRTGSHRDSDRIQ
jgi:hypothetical protein